MNNFNKELLEFLNIGTCTFTTTKKIVKVLKDNGYQEIDERKKVSLKNNKYYIVRNDASIIAFQIPKDYIPEFNIICTHNDTPTFMIKPNPEYYENGYLKLNVMPYGGILNYGFMDRALGISGRIIIKNNNVIKKEIVDLKRNITIIPSIAIHQNSKANSNLDLNTEIDLMPIISLDKNYSLKKCLKDYLNIKDEIYDYDLFLYNRDQAKIINNEFIASPRIDNLTCTYAALKAFLNSSSNRINILTIFNSEEIGSNTFEGADSNFLIDTLKRISANLNFDLVSALAYSIVVSADNTHARHPSHDELSDHTNTPILNDGILIMKEMNGTTNSITSSIFKTVCNKAKVPWNYYTSRNDASTGSTQAGVSLRHLSINSIDVGLPMLAMHSGLEIIGIKDTYRLYLAFKTFYKIKFKITNNEIVFK